MGTLLFKDSILEGSVLQGACFRRTLDVWVPCAGGSWHAETLLLGESCVGPYSVKPCYIDTLFRGTLVYRKSDVWGPCCVGILPEGVLLCRASSLRGPCVYRPALQGTIV